MNYYVIYGLNLNQKTAEEPKTYISISTADQSEDKSEETPQESYCSPNGTQMTSEEVFVPNNIYSSMSTNNSIANADLRRQKSAPEVQMPKKLSSIGSGKPITTQTKEIILNLKTYFEKKLEPCVKADVTYEISIATKLSEKSIRRIIKEKEDFGQFLSPKKTRHRSIIYSFNANEEQIIDTIVDQLNRDQELTRLKDVFECMQTYDELSFKNCSIFTFRNLMSKMGYNFSEKQKKLVKKKVTVKKNKSSN